MKNKSLEIFILTFLLLLFAGCEKATPAFSYNSFKYEFTKFSESFKSDFFTDITEEGLIVKTVSFPENHLDSRQADIIDNNLLSPARYEIMYQSNDKKILVKVNFIYFPECKRKQFITINSFKPSDTANISQQYKSITQPLLDEYLLSMNGYLILINFIDLNKDVYVTNEYRKSFIDSTLQFYEDFESALLRVPDK